MDVEQTSHLGHVVVIPRPARLERREPKPIRLGAPSDAIFGALSGSSGSILLDAAVGASVGYFLAPPSKRMGYIAVGAAATGLAGVLGLLGFLGYVYLADR